MKYKNWLKNIKGYSDKTIEVYQKYTDQLIKEKLDYERVILKYKESSSSTKRLILSAIKSYYKFIEDDRWNRIELPKREIKALDYITFDEYKKIINSLNKNTKMGFQKYLIIRLLFETGIRSSELLNIKKGDIYENRIKINGKGKKQRFINISNWLLSDLSEYIDSHNKNLLFCFSYKNLYSKIKRINTIDKKITPHMFRRGFAKYCNEKGLDIYDISLMMGHSSIETTAHYINKTSVDVSLKTIF